MPNAQESILEQPITQLEKTVKEPVKETSTLISHLVDQAERLTKLEVQFPQLGKDLAKQIADLESSLRTALSESREEQSKAANDTVKVIEDRLTKLEKSIDDFLAGGENGEEEPRTTVDKAHIKDHLKGTPPTPQEVTEIKPPPQPIGIRG